MEPLGLQSPCGDSYHIAKNCKNWIFSPYAGLSTSWHLVPWLLLASSNSVDSWPLPPVWPTTRLILQSWRNEGMSPRPHSLLLSVQLNAVVIVSMACAPPPAPWYFLVSFLHRGANTTQSPPHTHDGHSTEGIPTSNSSSSWAELPAAMHQKQACYYCRCPTKTGQIVIFWFSKTGSHYAAMVVLELCWQGWPRTPYRPLPPKCSDWKYVP